jgi:nicotinate-nucleotide pyrophosphorylase (carboxylating)
MPPKFALKIEDISSNVSAALAEDIGTGDITAQLIAPTTQASARIISRQAGVFCGRAWADEVFAQVDSDTEIDWLVEDGQQLCANDVLFTASGSARSLLTAERSALNFLQLLSGTATSCQQFANIVAGTGVKLLDTRKTIPGLRMAQKYAVTCGSCYNHRLGLYDAFLIKENHINACGSIEAAVTSARKIAPEKLLEVEVEADLHRQRHRCEADDCQQREDNPPVAKDPHGPSSEHARPISAHELANDDTTPKRPLNEPLDPIR